MVEGKVSPTIMSTVFDRETEKAALEARASQTAAARPTADLLPHSVLLEQFREKVAELHRSLYDDSIRTEAAQILEQLIESVTIYPDGPDGSEAEAVASVSALMTFAINANTAPKSGACDIFARVLRFTAARGWDGKKPAGHATCGLF